MTHQNQLQPQPLHPASFAIPMAIGAGIAFLVISFFVFGVDNPQPEWGQYWRVRPLIITPLAGATGGACYALLSYLSATGRINKILAVILGIVVYVIGLWMGTVLGLAGTMWD